MSASKIQANYDDLKSIAGLFANQSDSVRQLSNQVQRQCDLLENGGWIGRGAQNFYREMEQQVLPAMRRLSNALQGASQAVQQISHTFNQAEREAGSLFLGAIGLAQSTPTSIGQLFSSSATTNPSQMAWNTANNLLGFLASAAWALIDHADVFSKATSLKIGAFAGVMDGFLGIAYDLHEGKPLNDEVVVPHMLNALVQGVIGAKTGGVVPLVNSGVQLVGGLYTDAAKMFGGLAMPFAPNAAPDLMYNAEELSRSLKNVDFNKATFNTIQTGYISLKQGVETGSKGLSSLLGGIGSLFGSGGREIGSNIGAFIGGIGGGLLGGVIGTVGGALTEGAKFVGGVAETAYHTVGTSFNMVRVGVESLGHPTVQQAVSDTLTDVGRVLGFAR